VPEPRRPTAADTVPQARSGQAYSGQAYPGQAYPGQARSGRAHYGQARYSQARSGQAQYAPAPYGLVRTLRSAAADAAAALVVAVVVPLALLQLPDAIAWAIPARFADAGPAAVTSLLRMSGLALTAMAVAVPGGGLAVRRFRAWPVLMGGLAIVAAADVLGDTVQTIGQIGIDRALHGAGAGIALAAAIALAAERRSSAERRNRAGHAIAGWWAASAVAGLACAAELMRHRLETDDWHAALQPYPWLTGIALGVAALYALLAEGTVTASTRNEFPAAERALLAQLAVPVAGMCVVAVAVTYERSAAVTAAAIAEALALACLAVATARSGTARWFAVACAVAGFTVAPAAGAATDLMRARTFTGTLTFDRFGHFVLTEPELCGIALCGAALCGAAVAIVLPARWDRLVTGAGLLVAAAGFTAAYATGPRSQLLAAVCVPVAAGLSAALAAGLRTTGAPGAMRGGVLMLAGVLAGYLADGALELHAVDGADSSAATVHAALLGADLRWNLAAAGVTGLAGLAVFTSSRLLSRRATPLVAASPAVLSEE
jgi:MFS family permease